jgi:carboxylesterase
LAVVSVPVLPWAAAFAAIAAGLLLRARFARSQHDRQSRLQLGPGGIIIGAGPIDLPAAPGASPRQRAALLLHGFGDTPQTLAHLATYLHDRGWTVRVPLLPGHGRTLGEWARTRAADWLDAARTELATLRRQHDAVALVGLSMGGALAAVLAAEDSSRRTGAAPAGGNPSRHAAAAQDGQSARIVALVLIAPYLAMAWWIRTLAGLHYVITPILPYANAGGGPSILDPAERDKNLAYGVTTPRLVNELAHVVSAARAALPRITMPALLVQSRQDNRIRPATAEWAYEALGSADKRLVWIDRGGHVITADTGHEEVSSCVDAWLASHLAGRHTGNP